MADVRLAVIVSDFEAAMHVNADTIRTVRTFALPPEIAEYIAAALNKQHATVALAIDRTPKESGNDA